ncbi:C-glycoside deglycosidase beta subunit domain-containing protein [Novosphingobium subterraneum]|uniref:C-glycoside deglycosidase beta subunit domain-containing protein n=1 Tax=Novosphingobium subterraneum TaxID=48936 RepID=UPI003D08193B
MLPVERVIGEEGLAATASGLKLAMRLPWYRSLPFSVVEVGPLSVGGEAVDLSDALIEYNGQQWPLSENGEKVDTFWFIRDSAFLVLPSLSAEVGETREVSLNLFISPPYIPGMRRTNPQTSTLTVEAA